MITYFVAFLNNVKTIGITTIEDGVTTSRVLTEKELKEIVSKLNVKK